MKFNPEQVAFGRHESFQLRYGWPTKGYQALKKNKKVFDSDDATVELGVGKNMVASIRYWMRACGLLEGNKSELTEFAHYIFDDNEGVDPYLEDEATLWLIHWKLATNAKNATTWFWFFNLFHKPVFTGQELQTALYDFVKSNIKNKFAVSTIKGDALALTRMYCQSSGNTRTPLEEALDSPLSLLGLISQSAGGRSYQSMPTARPELALGVFGFAVMELMQAREKSILPIEDLMYAKDGYAALGALFRLTENDLITKLEQLVEFIPEIIEIRETAGIHQVYIKEMIEPDNYLEKHYQHSQRKDEAA